MKQVSAWHKWGLAVTLCVLAGCAPEYNWRELAVADGRVLALMPAKPSAESRDMTFEGHTLHFTLTSARVRDDLFVVGYAPWTPEFLHDAALRRQFGEGVLTSLYQNFGLAAPAVLPTQGQVFEFRGSPERPAWVRGRVWVTSHGLVEGLVTSAAASLPQPETDQFLDALAKHIRVQGG